MMNKMKQKYIHYGSRQYNPDLVKPIQNYHKAKPSGGFWGSPVDAKYGWSKWCKDEDFKDYEDDNFFTFTLSDNAKVIHIRTVEDVDNLPRISNLKWKFIDFEYMREEGVDAIELHLSECYDLYFAMYGWDCDSILVMNKEVVEIVE